MAKAKKKFYQSKSTISKLKKNPHIILSVIFFGFFAYWLASSFIPIIYLEAKYQLLDLFKGSNSGIKINSKNIPKSKYPNFGLVIPKLYLDERIIEQVNPNNFHEYENALKKGIAHSQHSFLPGNNKLIYLFAHSATPELKTAYNAVFYLLGKLDNKDQIIIWYNNKPFVYEVYDKKIVWPKDTKLATADYEQETLILQTCWPPGTSQKRLLVFAKPYQQEDSKSEKFQYRTIDRTLKLNTLTPTPESLLER